MKSVETAVQDVEGAQKAFVSALAEAIVSQLTPETMVSEQELHAYLSSYFVGLREVVLDAVAVSIIRRWPVEGVTEEKIAAKEAEINRVLSRPEDPDPTLN